MTAASGPRRRANALTVDVEDWFHICGIERELPQARWAGLPSRVVDTTRWLLDDLSDAGICGTFFVLGWVAERFPDLVAHIRAAGHEIGSHGYAHVRAYELGPAGFVADLARSVRTLRDAGAPSIAAYRAPEWSINDRSLWALELLVRHGFTIDASMAPVRMVGSVEYPRRPHVRQTAAGPLREYPPLVASRFGQAMPLGWGWGLRMSSPARVLDAIARLNRSGAPAVVAVHPWEIDPDPPRLPLPPRLRFAHYFRLDGFRQRLRRVLRGAEFGPLGDLPAYG